MKVEESQHAFDGMLLELEPFRFVEACGLVDDADVDPALPEIVEKSSQPQLIELDLVESKALSDDDTEDADVHAVGKGILVVVS